MFKFVKGQTFARQQKLERFVFSLSSSQMSQDSGNLNILSLVCQKLNLRKTAETEKLGGILKNE